MQYILTQEEYDNLKKKQSLQLGVQRKTLQALCTKIADEMPVVWGWGDPDPKPWGCPHSTEGEWYCDKCPVQTLCPGDKFYSQ